MFRNGDSLKYSLSYDTTFEVLICNLRNVEKLIIMLMSDEDLFFCFFFLKQ
jgi:hypothetical protein